MTNNDLISRIKNINKFANSDSRITNRFIYNLLLTTAKFLIKRDAEKLKYWRVGDLYQTINQVDLIEVDKAECCEITSGCTIWRSCEKLPKLMTTSNGFLIKRISPLDGAFNFTQTQESQYTYQRSKKYNTEKYFFIKNGYLYIPNANIEAVKVTAYFENDISYLNVCLENCQTPKVCRVFLKEQFMIPDYLLGELIDYTNKELNNFYQRYKQDNEQNKDIEK